MFVPYSIIKRFHYSVDLLKCKSLSAGPRREGPILPRPEQVVETPGNLLGSRLGKAGRGRS